MDKLNTRQKIMKLLQEGKSIKEVAELLKEEKVANISAYVYRVNRDLKNHKEHKELEEKAFQHHNVKHDRFFKDIVLICNKCKKEYIVTTTAINEGLYTPEIKATWICMLCKPLKERRIVPRIKRNYFTPEPEKSKEPVIPEIKPSDSDFKEV